MCPHHHITFIMENYPFGISTLFGFGLFSAINIQSEMNGTLMELIPYKMNDLMLNLHLTLTSQCESSKNNWSAYQKVIAVSLHFTCVFVIIVIRQHITYPSCMAKAIILWSTSVSWTGSVSRIANWYWLSYHYINTNKCVRRPTYM